MKRPLLVSVAFHLAILAVAYFGLNFGDARLPDADPPVLPVELVSVSDKANLPAPPPPKPEPEENKVDRMSPPPSPPKVDPPKPAPPETKVIPPEPDRRTPRVEKPKVALPAAKPSKPEPAEDDLDEKAQERADALRNAVASQRPIPKPSPPNDPPPSVPSVPDFDTVLKTVAELKQQVDTSEESTDRDREPNLFENEIAEALAVQNNSSSFDPKQAITMSELDVLRRQIERCWNVPAGAKDAEELIVSIRVEMNPDGTPRSAEIVERAKMVSDPYFEAAAESALRAVLNPRCHPFTLPTDKFEQWKLMTLTFNPKEFLGT